MALVMYWKLERMIKTLHMRLTLWNSVVFGMLALCVFIIAYGVVSRQLLTAVDVDLKNTAQEFSESLKTGGFSALKIEIDREIGAHGKGMFFACFLDENGQIQADKLVSTCAMMMPQPNVLQDQLQWFDIDMNKSEDSIRALALPVSGFGWIEIGVSLASYDALMAQIIAVFVPSLLIMLLIGVFVSWLQLRSVFHSVEQVQCAAIAISEGDLDHRVEFKAQGIELSRLADAFNMMLDRIQHVLGEMSDVSNHIAHDLRTPVSRIRGIAETCLSGNYPSDKEKISAQTDTLALIVGESEQLGAMIHTMLEIAQTDAGLLKQQKDAVDMVALLHEVHDLFLAVAEDAGITLLLSPMLEPRCVLGNKGRLQRVFANIIDNALKFSERGGDVSISVELDASMMWIHIGDQGVGMSAQDIAHAFERFYRSDQSRTTPGHGLGLSYAMSIVRSHGGDIFIESHLGEGSIFTVQLPLETA
ncbi:MAG: HAMP domain-containing sensor histidine kinase [Mariprofundaceae bacterium]|nr:HAMP domain-containing sensor histidine kinase [Mariprofundaceae bacterium]